MVEKVLVRGLDLNGKGTLPECRPCLEAAMTNGPMKSRTAVTGTPGTVIFTDVAEMHIMLLGSAKYFVVFMDEASGHLCAVHLKSNGDAASN